MPRRRRGRAPSWPRLLLDFPGNVSRAGARDGVAARKQAMGLITRALLLTFLIVLMPASAFADAALYQGLATDKFDQLERAITVLAASGDTQAPATMDALADGRVSYDLATKSVFYDKGRRDDRGGDGAAGGGRPAGAQEDQGQQPRQTGHRRGAGLDDVALARSGQALRRGTGGAEIARRRGAPDARPCDRRGDRPSHQARARGGPLRHPLPVGHDTRGRSRRGGEGHRVAGQPGRPRPPALPPGRRPANRCATQPRRGSPTSRAGSPCGAACRTSGTACRLARSCCSRRSASRSPSA